MKSLSPVVMVIASLGLSVQVFAACTPQANIPLEKPDSIYVVNGNGTVTDFSNGLMWKQCSEGLTYSAGACTGTATTYTWQAALGLGGTSYATYSDWRLPNANELASLVDHSCSAAPRINVTIFPSTVATTAGIYWASTPYGNTGTNAVNAWYVNFNNGVESFTTKNSTARYVRLVRGGQ